jgi:thiamine biosynthesis lipoprotein
MSKDITDKIVVRREFRKFGTDIDFQIIVNDKSLIASAEKMLEDAEKKCDDIEKIFSRFDENSILMKLNANLGNFIEVPEIFLNVSMLVIKYYNETKHHFDPRIITQLEQSGYNVDFKEVAKVREVKDEKIVNFEKDLTDDLIIENDKVVFYERMDFTGIVKGFTVDYISNEFSKQGWENFLVDCGGDMFFSGNDKNGNPWYIDIEGIPYENLMLSLSGCGIATSGIGKRKWEVEGNRFHHLINPNDIGRYSFDLKSVTVVDVNTEKADVWAKTLYIMGKEEAKKFANEKNIAAAIIDYSGSAWISSELKKYLLSNI